MPPRQRFLCPKPALALTRLPIGRGPGPRASSRMRGGGALAVSWFRCPSRGRGQSSGFILQRRSRPHPRPRRGRGLGGGGHRQPHASGPKGRAHRRAARGGAAPPNEGRGRTTAPGTSAGSPTRRAAPVRRTPNQTKRLSFVRLAGDWAPGQLLTKLAFCWVRPVVAAAELWRRCAPLRISGKSSEKRVMGR